MIMRWAAVALVSAAFLCAGPADAAKKIKDGTISITFGPEPETMDPHTSSSALAVTVHRYVFDTLMTRLPGEAIPSPWAAKSAKAIGPQTYEYQLREGVKFANGEDVDAAAVKFSLMRPLDPKLKTVQARIFRGIDRVEEVEKWTVRVHLKSPDPTFLNRTANWGNLVPPKHYAGADPRALATKPVGSGPYRLVRWQKDEGMVFEANPDYWHPDLPKVKRVKVVAIPEMGARVAALLKGEVDIIRDIPAQFIPRIEASPRTRVVTTRNVRILHLGFSHEIGGPIQDRRVRQAIAHAIDRETIVKGVVEGKGALASQPLHQWTEGHDPGRKWPYAYDPEKAKKLLAEAGYPNGFEIDFHSTVGRYPKDKEVAEVIAGMLRKVGVRVNHNALTWQAFVNRFRGKSRPGTKPFLFYIGYGNGGGETDITLNALAGCKGAWSAYCNPAFDALIDMANSTLGLKERDRLFRRMTEALARDVSHVFIWQMDDVYGLAKRVDWKVRNDDRIYPWEIDLK